MKVKSASQVAQSCPTLRDPVDCSLPGSSAHGIFQARVLRKVKYKYLTNEEEMFIIYATDKRLISLIH